MNKITKIIISFLTILFIYYFNLKLVNNPPEGYPQSLEILSFWFNNVIIFPKKVIMYLISGFQINELIFNIINIIIWTFIVSLFFGKNENNKIMKNIDKQFINDKKTYVFELKSIKQKIFSNMGLFFLTDFEDFIIYKLSNSLAFKNKKILLKQLKEMNRSYRLESNETGNVAITVFDKLNLFGKKKHFNEILPSNEPYECVVASAVLISNKNYISVDLIATLGVISRLQFSSDKSIKSIKGAFIIEDIKIHESFLDKEKIYGQDFDELD